MSDDFTMSPLDAVPWAVHWILKGLTIRPALLPQESVLSCQFKHKSNFKPKTSQCGTHAL